MTNTIVLDNGAGFIRAGKVSQYNATSDEHVLPSFVVSNCTANVKKQMVHYVGDQVDKVVNKSMLQYSRPFERGYLCKMDLEIEIWSRLFSHNCLNVNPTDCNLVITEPPFNLEALENDYNEVIFEDFNFARCLRRPATWFSAFEFSRNAPHSSENSDSCTVIDSGFSFTHVVPHIALKPQTHACKRIDVGGKLLTNYLKEIVSYRQWNMMDEFKLIEQVKEDLCYVSMDIVDDLQNSRTKQECNKSLRDAKDAFQLPLKRHFVLPDFQSINKGYVKPLNSPTNAVEQLLVMESERFSVPEVLFRPQLVGMNQAGICEAFSQSLDAFQHDLEVGLVSQNIVLTGGNAKFPHFHERIERDIRKCVPDVFPTFVYTPPNPDSYAWQGANRFVKENKQMLGDIWESRSFVSRQEYLEHGHHYCNQQMKRYQ